jgi:myo-inositol-1(or 4)-monophosphatase
MLDFLESVAREAGAVLMRHLGGSLAVDKKGARDLVTVADRESEALILRRIREAFPRDAVQAEESASAASDAERQWIVDPLDGTTNFVYAIPHFAVSIGVWEHGAPLAACVFNPVLEECFLARRGGGATKNGARIRVRQESRLSEAVLCTGFSYRMEEKADSNLQHFADFSACTRGLRRLGSAALDLCYVGEGRYDGYWELHLSAWDVAAGGLVALEAGAAVTDFRGGDAWLRSGEVVAANPALNAAMREVLARYRP